jgi:Ni/Co efflux regulator RcnB
MTKLLSALIAAVFAVASLTSVAIAQEKKGEATATEKKDGKADKKKSEGKKAEEKK